MLRHLLRKQLSARPLPFRKIKNNLIPSDILCMPSKDQTHKYVTFSRRNPRSRTFTGYISPHTKVISVCMIHLVKVMTRVSLQCWVLNGQMRHMLMGIKASLSNMIYMS